MDRWIQSGRATAVNLQRFQGHHHRGPIYVMGCWDRILGRTPPEDPLMGNLFGSQAAEPAPAPAVVAGAGRREVSEADRATLKLQIQRDKLQQHTKKSAFMIEKRREAAKALAQAGKKKEAILALKTKKMIEQQLAITEGQLMQLEEMISAIHQAGMQARVVDGLKAGNEALKELQKQIGTVEDVQNLMDDTADAMAYQQELNDALSGQFSADDDAELEAEMAALEAEEEALQALELGAQLPDAPTTMPEGVQVSEPVTAAQEPVPRRSAAPRQMVAA